MTWDPASQVEELAKKKLQYRLGVKKELRILPSHLSEGEQVLNLSSGMYDGANGLAVLTDRRVIFISAGVVKRRFEDFPYSKISSVQHSAGLVFGELIIFASGNKAELKNMFKDRAKEIADYIRDRISVSEGGDRALSSQPPDDSLEKLRKLGELRDAGVVSPEEFENKKRQLLAQI